MIQFAPPELIKSFSTRYRKKEAQNHLTRVDVADLTSLLRKVLNRIRLHRRGQPTKKSWGSRWKNKNVRKKLKRPVKRKRMRSSSVSCKGKEMRSNGENRQKWSRRARNLSSKLRARKLTTLSSWRVMNEQSMKREKRTRYQLVRAPFSKITSLKSRQLLTPHQPTNRSRSQWMSLPNLFCQFMHHRTPCLHLMMLHHRLLILSYKDPPCQECLHSKHPHICNHRRILEQGSNQDFLCNPKLLWFLLSLLLSRLLLTQVQFCRPSYLMIKSRWFPCTKELFNKSLTLEISASKRQWTCKWIWCRSVKRSLLKVSRCNSLNKCIARWV